MTHTSLVRAMPMHDKACVLCHKLLPTKAYDLELDGRICDDCLPFLREADYLLGALPMLFCRPELGYRFRN
jgi:hypothetical protein